MIEAAVCVVCMLIGCLGIARVDEIEREARNR